MSHFLPLGSCFICRLNIPPKTAQYPAVLAGVSCWLHFYSKELWLFIIFFLKWMQNSSFVTSITCSLTPTTSNLVDTMAMASKHLFTRRSLHVWGLGSFVRYVTDFQKSLCNKASYLSRKSAYTFCNQSKLLSHITFEQKHCSVNWELAETVG